MKKVSNIRLKRIAKFLSVITFLASLILPFLKRY